MPRAWESAVPEAAELRTLRLFAFLIAPVAAFDAWALHAGGAAPVVVARLVVVLALVVVVILSLTFTPLGERRPRALAHLLTVSFTAVSLWTSAVTHRDPLAAADDLVAIMVGTLLFFRWTPREALLLALPASVVFVLVTLRGERSDFAVAPVDTAIRTVLVGGGLTLAGSVLIARLADNLARRQSELAALSARLMSVQEDERRRLSRELHDGLGQSMTAILSHLWLLDHRLPPDATELRRQVGETRRLASATLAEVRELSQLLRPSVLDDYGLAPSLDSHLRAFEQRHAIACSFDAHGLPDRLPAPIETAVYRIVQEALANVARHANAHHVYVRLQVNAGHIVLSVGDDGVGLPADRDPGAPRVGLGLVGIRERVRALGGSFTLSSHKGARLEVALPLPPPAT